jgi:hypothetical protein
MSSTSLGLISNFGGNGDATNRLVRSRLRVHGFSYNKKMIAGRMLDLTIIFCWAMEIVAEKPV